MFPPFFLWPLGFLSFTYLFFLVNDKRINASNILVHFIYGTVYGLGINLIFLNWIKEPFLIDPLTENLSLYSYLLIFYVSVFFGFSFIILSFFKNKFSKFILIPILFVICEILIENILYGFPWLTFALISTNNHVFIQIAYFIGTNGLSYLVLSIFLIPSIFILLIKNRLNIFFKTYIIFFIITIFVLSTFSIVRLNFSKDLNNHNKINITLNQLNINQSDKNDDLIKKKTLDEIISNIEKGQDNISIFSETDYPYLIKNNDIVDFFQNVLNENQSIIIGGIRKDVQKYYNSMYFITKDSFQVFDKKILVPFGEFLPFRKYLTFLDVIVGSIDFEVGKKDRLIQSEKNINFIPIICYEIIFFNDLLQKNNHGIPLLINITNDAWFGKYSGPYQHFYLSRIRSVEFNKFLIRVSNNGVSGIIDNYGRIINYLPLNFKGQKIAKLNIPVELNNLVKYHNLIYYFIFLVFALVILIEKKIARYKSEI